MAKQLIIRIYDTRHTEEPTRIVWDYPLWAADRSVIEHLADLIEANQGNARMTVEVEGHNERGPEDDDTPPYEIG